MLLHFISKVVKLLIFYLYLNPAILHAIKPSRRKSLARLDIAASGMNAFNGHDLFPVNGGMPLFFTVTPEYH